MLIRTVKKVEIEYQEDVEIEFPSYVIISKITFNNAETRQHPIAMFYSLHDAEHYLSTLTGYTPEQRKEFFEIRRIEQ